MKRLLILFVFVMFVFTAFLHAEFTNQIEFIGYHLRPTNVVGYTLYDYMNGAYNGFPMRIHDEGIVGQGIYFTYMVQPLGEERKQHWAWAEIGATEIGDRDPLTNYSAHREGFGTLAIDPITGNPIFAWHTVPYSIENPPSNYQGKLNSYFTWDRFFWYNTGGQGWANDEAILADNFVLDPDDLLRHEYSWPVVMFGPSPVAGKSRLYAFFNNSAPSFQVNSGATSGFTPSSTALVVYGDLGQDDWNDLHAIVWTEKQFDYLEKMHRWNPAEYGHPDRTSARAFLGYGVAPKGNYAGHVVLAGQVSGEYTRWDWNEWGDHNHVIILSKDYGETFEINPFLLENRPPREWTPQLDQDWLAELSPEHRNSLLESYNSFIDGAEGMAMEPALLNNKTVIFDNNGNIHFPSMYGIFVESGSWYPETVSTQMFAYNMASKEILVNHLVPEVLADMPHSIPWTFDLDNDGIMDRVVFPDGWPTVFPRLIPMFYHYTREEGTWFNYNQMRLTENNNGYMALMWFDSTKAYLHNGSSGEYYPDYPDTPELHISMTRDSGKTWSKPYIMAYNSEPGYELSLNPDRNFFSFVYPADKLIVLDRDKVRLYFMYNDDFAYGSSVNNNGLANGTAIRYTAIDFDVSGLTENEGDIFLPRPESMLAQNFPNPFNPSTTIRFNIPQSGNIRLNVYNIRGQLVNTLLDDTLPTGEHRVTWTGVDNNGRDVASGIYFYRLETNGVTETKRMVLMK